MGAPRLKRGPRTVVSSVLSTGMVTPLSGGVCFPLHPGTLQLVPRDHGLLNSLGIPWLPVLLSPFPLLRPTHQGPWCGPAPRDPDAPLDLAEQPQVLVSQWFFSSRRLGVLPRPAAGKGRLGSYCHCAPQLPRTLRGTSAHTALPATSGDHCVVNCVPTLICCGPNHILK